MPAWLATRPETFQRFSAKYHTTTPELAELAAEARPQLLILYHYAEFVCGRSCSKTCCGCYSGHVVVGRDLDVY